MAEFRPEAVDLARRRERLPPGWARARLAEHQRERRQGSNGDRAEEDEAELRWRPRPPGDPRTLAGIPIVSAETMRYRSRATIPHVAGLEAADRALGLARVGELERGEVQARDVLERIAGETRAKLRERMLELRAAKGRNGSTPPGRRLYTSSSPDTRLPAILRLLHHRADRCIDLIARQGVADDDERLLLLSYVVWPGKADPHYQAVTTGEVRPAGEAELDTFLRERCEVNGGETDVGDIARAFADWCADRGMVAPHWRSVVAGRWLPKRGVRSRRVFVAASALGERGRGEHRYVVPLTLRPG